MAFPLIVHVYNITESCLDCGNPLYISLMTMSNKAASNKIRCSKCGALVVIDVQLPAITASIHEHGPMMVKGSALEEGGRS